MDAKTKLTTAAERLFDRDGYMATGVDRLIEAAGISSRTLYKHAGSKAALMTTVLTERDRRFMRRLQVRRVDALFGVLEDWVLEEGAHGCLFLRTSAETGGKIPEISRAVSAHKAAFRSRVAEIVAADLGGEDRELADQVVVLFEGALHAAVYLGTDAVASAREAAAALLERKRSLNG